MQDCASDRDPARPERAARGRHHPGARRGREDRPRPGQDAERRAIRGDRRRRRLDRRDRRRGPGARRRGRRPPRAARGRRAAIRDGWAVGVARRRPYLALVSGDDQHEPGELAAALDALLAAEADYVQGSRWMPGGQVVGAIGGRGCGTRLYSLVFSVLAVRRVTDATNGFRVFRSELLRDPAIDLDQALARQLRPRAVRPVQGDPRGYRVIELPVTVRYHADEGYTKMRGMQRLVAAVPARPAAADRGEAMSQMSTGALVRGAAGPRDRRGRLRRRGRDPPARGRGRPGDRPRRPVHGQGRRRCRPAPSSSEGR